MSSLFDWSPNDDPAELHDVSAPGVWESLVTYYTEGRGNGPLERVFDIAKAHDVQTVLVERRYIDFDWRSEHSRFYSTTFARYPSVCHRMHFFAGPGPVDFEDLSAQQPRYRGYCILRPLASAPVGRTMVTPPPEVAGGTFSAATETVDVLGWPLTITSMPFMSQDAQYLRCAHAAMWMILQHAHLRRGAPRRLPREIQEAALGGVIASRQLPSDGLSVQQMLGGLTALGLSPGLAAFEEEKSKDDARPPFLSLHATVCRYVNCNLPPIVISRTHAWVVVGYVRTPSAGHPSLTLYRHDDAVGPYIRVGDPYSEPNAAHQPWLSGILPLPPKIYMNAERAEAVGRHWFDDQIINKPVAGKIMDALAAGALTFQTYGLRSSTFKQDLASRQGFPADIAKEYRLTGLPRHVWVVEAVDRRLRDSVPPQSSVLGEVLIDPTAHHEPSVHDLGILATHGFGRFEATSPDHLVARSIPSTAATYASGRDT